MRKSNRSLADNEKNPFFGLSAEQVEQFKQDARPAALRMEAVAIKTDDPVGLRIVLDALFGTEIYLCEKREEET